MTELTVRKELLRHTFYGIVHTIERIDHSVDALNGCKTPLDFQTLSGTEDSPSYISRVFSDTIAPFLQDETFYEDVPDSSRLDYVALREALSDARDVLDVVGHDWDDLYKKGQDFMAALGTSKQIDEAVELAKILKEGYAAAVSDLKDVALFNARFLVRDLGMD